MFPESLKALIQAQIIVIKSRVYTTSKPKAGGLALVGVLSRSSLIKRKEEGLPNLYFDGNLKGIPYRKLWQVLLSCVLLFYSIFWYKALVLKHMQSLKSSILSQAYSCVTMPSLWSRLPHILKSSYLDSTTGFMG
jgi:hypothetical protein